MLIHVLSAVCVWKEVVLCYFPLGERTCDRDGSALGIALFQVRAELLGFGLGFSKCQNRDDFSFEVLSGTLFFLIIFFFFLVKRS